MQAIKRCQGRANDAGGSLPEFQVSAWNAIFAPKSLPQNIRAKLNDALVKALDDGAKSKGLLQIGSVIPEKMDRTP